MNVDQLLALLKHLVPQIEILILVIVIDFLIGVSSAVKNHQFDARKLPDILAQYGLRTLGWLSLEALSLIPEDFLLPSGFTSAIGDGALALIVTSALASIINSAKELAILPKLPAK